MGPGRVVVMQIVKEINTSVECIEDTTAEPESPVQELNWTDERAGKDVFQPCEALFLVS